MAAYAACYPAPLGEFGADERAAVPGRAKSRPLIVY